MSQDTQDTSTIHNIRLDKYFTTTSNFTPEDPNLSWEAKGLLWYILSRPSDWKIHTWQLAKIYQGKKTGGGLYAIKQILRELRENGYVKYTKTRNPDNGKFIHRYDVYPMKIDNFQKMFPEVDFPTLGFPTMENQPDIINNEIPSTELKKSDLIERADARVKIFDFEGKEIILSKEDLFSLAVQQSTDWTSQEVNLLYEKLAKYNGKVRDLTNFCKAIIKKERIINNIDKHKNRNKECLPKQAKSQDLSPLKSQSEIIKKQTLMEAKKMVGTQEHVFHNWKEKLGF